MNVISRKRLIAFWRSHPEARGPLSAWFSELKKARWTGAAGVRARFPSASLVGQDRIVFNIAGNKYRLVVRVNYPYRVMYIRFIGTHREYDEIDVAEA
ncbi:MAG TPA: type II toxin-antitoxin system HigB family toxin [Myxococcales bacterium]|nr:type II toxin-antitoxin system HigB family toxin [Myxococcales bacterium]